MLRIMSLAQALPRERHIAFRWGPFVALLIGLSLLVTNGFAKNQTTITTISGKVLGHDGQPLKSAHVHIARRAYYLNIHKTAPVALDGSFQLETDLEGYYHLIFSGVGHATLEVPIWFYEPANLTLEVRLGTYNYAKDWSKVAIKNLVDGGSQALLPTGEGTFTASVSTEAASLVYVIENVSEFGEPIADLNADTYLLDARALRYQSIVPVKGKRIRIVFDPTLLPPAGKAPSLEVLDTTSPTARLFALQAEIRLIEQDVFEQQQIMLAEKGLNTREADRASVDDAVKKFQASFIDKLKANFAERLSQASNPAVQKAYLVTLVNLPGELAPEFAKHVLVTISPLDPAWGFGSRGIKRAIESTDEPETYEDYLQLAATKNPIEDVRGELLFDPMLKAYFAKDKVAWEKHYDMLMTHAPNSARAVYARRRFNPNPIEVGEEIPSFSIASLGDEEIVYSKESMKGTYYLIDFWATWCVPCIAELPRLHRMYEMYKDTNFTILSLSFDQIAQDIAPFREKRWPMPWHHAFVEDGFKNQLARDFHVSGIPKPILVDPKGRIVAIGEQLEGENLEKILAEILGNKPKNQ